MASIEGTGRRLIAQAWEDDGRLKASTVIPYHR